MQYISTNKIKHTPTKLFFTSLSQHTSHAHYTCNFAVPTLNTNINNNNHTEKMNLPPPACLSMCLAPPSSEFSLVIFYYENFLLII